MSKFIRSIHTHLSLAALALATAAAGSASAAIATATSTSTVVTPIAIASSANLSFGSFSPGTGGTVTVSPDGSRGVTGGVVQLPGATTAAKFDVTGQTGFTYSISLGGATVLTRGSGPETMAFTPVSALTASNITSGTVAAGTLTGGAQSIYVGGVLTVGASQPGGTYDGEVTATVEYN